MKTIKTKYGVFKVQDDKHLYRCKKCGFLLQSKHLGLRSFLDVEGSPVNNHICEFDDFKRICDCVEVV